MLTASGKFGQAGIHVLSVVVMDKSQGHDHVLTRRHCTVVERVLETKQMYNYVKLNHVQVCPLLQC